MAEQPLVRSETAPRPARGRGPVFVIAALVVAAAVAGAAWWFLAGRQAAPDWERLTELDLAAPAGYAFSVDTPWMRVLLAPARPGAANTLRISLAAPKITPVPDSMSATVAALLVQPLSGETAQPQQLSLQMGPDGGLVATAPLDRAGWWRVMVVVEGSPQPAELYLLLPDPNVNGPGAVQSTGSSAEGEAVFRRAIDGIHALHSVRYAQWLGDGNGNDSVSEHAVTSGEGTPTAFTFRVTGGIEAVVIGSTRWIHLPDPAGWQEQETSPAIPLSQWGEEYAGATGFTLLGEETIDGEACQLLAFVVPEQTEPRRQTVAWYLWWVGKETGHLRKEAMASRVHYMKNDFSDFDAPFVIAPPQMPATPIPATPAS